jgi:hypothetical protein
MEKEPRGKFIIIKIAAITDDPQLHALYDIESTTQG